jgi:hypothetical protein
MLEAGRQPFRVIPPDSNLFKKNFASREDIAGRFPEAAKCQPNGKSPCYFLFARGPNVRKVRVMTLDEANGL